MVVSEVEMAVTCSEDMTGTPHDLKCGIAKKAIGSCRSRFRSSTQLAPRLAQIATRGGGVLAVGRISTDSRYVLYHRPRLHGI